MPRPAFSSQSHFTAVNAEDLVTLLVGESLCKPKPQFQSSVKVKMSSSSLVQKCSHSNLRDLFVKSVSATAPVTCVSSGSLAPVVTRTVMSPSSVLSPLAQPFSMVAADTLYLYPAGKDKLGRTVITDENSAMQLDYFEVEPDPLD